MYRYSKSTVTLPNFPDFWVIWPSEIRVESDMADSSNFYSSEIWVKRCIDFCVHTA